MRQLQLVIAYDGTNYHGWQIQPNALTVQQVLADAIARIMGHEVKLTGASRTDRGVHAKGQVATFKTANMSFPACRLPFALQALLPKDIVVTTCTKVDLNFHPQHHAISKSYVYHIYNSPHPDIFWRRYAWHVPRELSVSDMAKAAAHLVGEKDFSSFCCAGNAVKSTVRTVFGIEVCQVTPSLISISVQGNGFLYKMVRTIVGTLVEVGGQQRPVDSIPKIIQAKDRACAGSTAPAHGLVLEHIRFDD